MRLIHKAAQGEIDGAVPIEPLASSLNMAHSRI